MIRRVAGDGRIGLRTVKILLRRISERRSAALCYGQRALHHLHFVEVRTTGASAQTLRLSALIRITSYTMHALYSMYDHHFGCIEVRDVRSV